jgi:hypothetical protein
MIIEITKVGRNVPRKFLQSFNKQKEGQITPLFFDLSAFYIN